VKRHRVIELEAHPELVGTALAEGKRRGAPTRKPLSAWGKPWPERTEDGRSGYVTLRWEWDEWTPVVVEDAPPAAD